MICSMNLCSIILLYNTSAWIYISRIPHPIIKTYYFKNPCCFVILKNEGLIEFATHNIYYKLHNSIEVAYWDYLSLTIKYYSFIQCLCSPKSYKVFHFAKTNSLIEFGVCNICSELWISIEISYWDYLSLTVGYCSFLNLW